MSTATAVAFDLHGVRVRIESELPAFLDYARVALEPWLVDDTGRFDIRSRLQWRDGLPPGKGNRNDKDAGGFDTMVWTRRPDRDLTIGLKGAQWLRIDDFPDLQMELAMKDDSVELTGRYFFHLAAGGSDRRNSGGRARQSSPVGGGDRIRVWLLSPAGSGSVRPKHRVR